MSVSGSVLSARTSLHAGIDQINMADEKHPPLYPL